MRCRIRKYDDRQFEIKVAYPLRRGVERGRHQLDLYFFIPHQLSINPAAYTPEVFYQDMVSFTRFKRPKIGFHGLMDPGRTTSPLYRIAAMLQEDRRTGEWNAKRLTYEYKTLANIMNRLLIRREKHFLIVIQDGHKLVDELNPVLERLVLMRNEFLSGAPQVIREAACFAEEYISICAEQALLRLLQKQDSAEASGGKELRGKIVELRERRMKIPNAAQLIPTPEQEEEFLYRARLLGEYCGEVLYLAHAQRRLARPAHHVLQALAAGVAMGAAAFAAWLAAKRFPPQSGPFLAAAIVAYMFKDRIKALLQSAGRQVVPFWFGDVMTRLVDPRERCTIGKTHESMRWRHPKEVPAEIIAARASADAVDSPLSMPSEQIMRFSREVTLDHRSIYQRHQRSMAIDEFLRIDVGKWLKKLDEPVEEAVTMGESGKVVAEQVLSVYPVTMVVSLKSDLDSQPLRVVRLILTKNGLERIEEQEARSAN